MKKQMKGFTPLDRRSRHLTGFTLLELLVVVIIIGILASVALPQFGKAIDRAREAEVQNILAAILSAELAYYQENNKFTSTPSELLVTVPAMKDWDVPTYDIATAGKVKVQIKSKHGHGDPLSHRLDGEITDTGSKTVTPTRP